MGKENTDSEQTRKRTDYYADLTYNLIVPHHMSAQQFEDLLHYIYYSVGRTFVTHEVVVNGTARTHRNAYRKCAMCKTKIGNFGNNFRSHMRRCSPIIYREMATKRFEQYFAIQKELQRSGLKESLEWQRYNQDEMEELVRVIMAVQPKYTRHISRKRKRSLSPTPPLTPFFRTRNKKPRESENRDAWFRSPDAFIKSFIQDTTREVQKKWKNHSEPYSNRLDKTITLPKSLNNILAQHAYSNYKDNCERFEEIFTQPISETNITEEEYNEKLSNLSKTLDLYVQNPTKDKKIEKAITFIHL